MNIFYSTFLLFNRAVKSKINPSGELHFLVSIKKYYYLIFYWVHIANDTSLTSFKSFLGLHVHDTWWQNQNFRKIYISSREPEFNSVFKFYVWLGVYCWQCRKGNLGQFIDPYKPITSSAIKISRFFFFFFLKKTLENSI